MLKEQFFLFKNETNLKGEEKLIIQFKFFKIFAKEKETKIFFYLGGMSFRPERYYPKVTNHARPS